MKQERRQQCTEGFNDIFAGMQGGKQTKACASDTVVEGVIT